MKKTAAVFAALLLMLSAVLPVQAFAAAGTASGGVTPDPSGQNASSSAAVTPDPSGQGTAAAGTASAGQDHYLPIDVVLVIDNSGSMSVNGQAEVVMQAVRTFANMMPAEDSRLGIVGFTQVATVYTTDADGNPAFVDMNDINSVEEIRTITTDAIKIEGRSDTNIGAGLKSATEIFEADGRPADEASRAILLFTDGVDDFENQGSELQQERLMAACDEDRTEAEKWCAANACPVYCLGFDYQLPDGKNSISGQGGDKLSEIASQTGGNARTVQNGGEIEDAFSEILADMCELQYSPLADTALDGSEFTQPIRVTAGIVEMNIRITFQDAVSLSNDSIRLLDPAGSEVPLRNEGNVRFELEPTTVSIKVIHPDEGGWTLVLHGIVSDNIKIGLLNHYQISLDASLSVPAGNPGNTAYPGDTVTISCTMMNQGQPADASFYAEITEAAATVTNRLSGTSSEIQLTAGAGGGPLTGTYTLTENNRSAYDISITVRSDYYEKTAELVLLSADHPIELIPDAEIPDQQVDTGKSIEVTGINSYVSDADGDAWTVSAEAADPDIVRVETADGGDTIRISGEKWGSTLVNVTYTDPANNTVKLSFSVSCRDIVKILLLSLIPVIIAAAVIAAAVIWLLRSRRVSGVFSVGPVMMMRNGYLITVGRPVRMRAVQCARGRRTSFLSFMNRYASMVRTDPMMTMEQQQALSEFFGGAGMNETPSILNKIAIEGTVLGKKGFVLNIPAGLNVRLDNRQPGSAAKVNIYGMRPFMLEITSRNGDAIRIQITYEQHSRQ